MPPDRPPLSGYRLMWLLVMFDLPVLTKAERKAASDFRKHLLDLGFEMSQFSVYLRYCTGQSQANTLSKQVEHGLPGGGKVNVLQITDKQYERVLCFRAGIDAGPQKPPDQYLLF
jgi:CRISPR-associated protein Cas2